MAGELSASKGKTANPFADRSSRFSGPPSQRCPNGDPLLPMAQKPLVLDDEFLSRHGSGGNATLAIFDLDRTLVSGSSLLPFASELANVGLLERRAVARAAISNARYRRRGASDGRVDAV